MNENLMQRARQAEFSTRAIENSDDPELIEEIARTELGMVTKNEKVFYDISG